MRIDTTAPLEDLLDACVTFPALARAGNDAGFSFEAEHDPVLPLAVAAEHTRSLELGTAVAIAFGRNPMTWEVATPWPGLTPWRQSGQMWP
ncbi:MAG: LLM class flavin-dependent oxidoreductase [Deltaproteobacteria bacterium]|nr:LLM class flavin-dependent oxidoreductase [Deltaproteobacteria bacterium]